MKSLIHSEKTKNKIVLETCLLILPLFLYAIYKNGYLLYQRNLISLIEVFKPLLYLGISLVIYEIIKIIFKHHFVIEYDLIYYLLIGLMVMPNTNIYYYSAVVFGISLLFSLFFKRLPINQLAVMKLVLTLVAYLTNTYEYRNLLELKYSFSFNYFDLLMGHQIGAIGTTSIILVVIIYFILSYRQNIKSLIPIVSYITYFIGSLAWSFYTHNFIFENIVNANVIFALVLVATDNMSSPNGRVAQIIYSVIIGILTIIFSLTINYYEGVYIAILIAGIFKNLDEYLANLLIFAKK